MAVYEHKGRFLFPVLEKQNVKLPVFKYAAINWQCYFLICEHVCGFLFILLFLSKIKIKIRTLFS